MKRILNRIFTLLPLLTLFVAATFVQAQFSQSASTPVHEPSALKPPPGARVAIYEFGDMECPHCAYVNPILKDASEKYHIPWLRHDFPLPMHAWSFDGAVDARWFDTKSKALGDAFRDSVFANQSSIQTPEQLRAFAENFATLHKVIFPFVVDPQGKLTAAVKADAALAQRIGVEHTPTIWIVTNQTNATPYVEVPDISQLYAIIDQALADTAHQHGHSTGATHHRTPSKNASASK